jgi:hypothetical protein
VSFGLEMLVQKQKPGWLAGLGLFTLLLNCTLLGIFSMPTFFYVYLAWFVGVAGI